ncbi:hypothetical protein [Chlamydia felis Fe/C-56]|uniref:Uncharacterized protein n=1 Tax=Chlamydia felis (strain Fe/C-56) TaxID=264202 RepID=Q254C6_CHLFF|nr:hypothetical protein [Chlamydia felis]BAE81362.1 hypothetical protein [Chlamydia felis Fe/C-56]
MKDKINNKENEDSISINMGSRAQLRATPDPALFTLTKTGITSTKPINMSNQNITGLANPQKDSDAVSLDYLQSNYVSKTDPNSGYLQTKGGTMSGDINMGGHSVTNITIPNTNGANGTLDPSSAATVQYVMDTADKVTNNPEINKALEKISAISTKVSTIEAALGIVQAQDPVPPPTQPSSPTTRISISPASSTQMMRIRRCNKTSTSSLRTGNNTATPPQTDTSTDPTQEDTSQFVRITGSSMSGDLDMSQHTVKNIRTPGDSDTKDAANVEYLQSKITTPQIGLLGNTINTTTTVTDDFDWKSSSTTPPVPPAPSPSQPITTLTEPTPHFLTSTTTTTTPTTSPTTTPTTPQKTDNMITTPVTDKYLKIDDSDSKVIKVLAPGITTLSVTANWDGDTAANISVILNPSTTRTTNGNTTTANDTTVYNVLALKSGQNLFCQIPVTQPSDLKLKFTPPTTGGGSGGGTGNNSLTVTSWSWQVTLLPSIFPTTTNP